MKLAFSTQHVCATYQGTECPILSWLARGQLHAATWLHMDCPLDMNMQHSRARNATHLRSYAEQQARAAAKVSAARCCWMLALRPLSLTPSFSTRTQSAASVGAPTTLNFPAAPSMRVSLQTAQTSASACRDPVSGSGSGLHRGRGRPRAGWLHPDHLIGHYLAGAALRLALHFFIHQPIAAFASFH